jgi:hypothetical protein
MARRRAALFITGGIVFAAAIWFIVSYAVIPVLSYGSAPIPSSCTGTVSHLPSSLDYTLPNIGTGALLASDATSAVIVMTDYSKSPLISTVYLMRKSDNTILHSFTFGNDIVDAGIADGMLFLYNDKIGYFLNVDTGEDAHFLFTVDNYRGLYTSGNARYIQTNLEISGIKSDSEIVSHLKMNMKSIVFGCLIPD